MTSKGHEKAKITTPTDLEIRTERVFDAPRELVFRAMTEADLIAQWWGRENTETEVEELDLRPGGAWRFAEKDNEDGIAFYGEFREIDPPNRIVQTFSFDGNPGNPMVETMELEDIGGKTLVKTLSVFDTVEERDGMIDAPMETGLNESYAALDTLLARLKEGGE